MINDPDIAWLAGFFDAEGTVGVSRHGRIYTPNLCVGNTDMPTLSVVTDILDAAGLYYCVAHTQRRRPRRPFWQINANGYTKCVEWLNVLLPYLRTKYSCAKILHDYAQSGVTNHKPGQRWTPYSTQEWSLLTELGAKLTMEKRHTRRQVPLPCESLPINIPLSALSATDYAWLGGFIDGDGSLLMVPVMEKYFVPAITIPNTHMPTLPYVCSILDDAQLIYYYQAKLRPSGKRRRQYWRISIRGLERCRQWLNIFSRYLYTKRHLAELMLTYCHERQYRRYTFKGYTTLDRAILAEFNKFV